MRILNPNDPEDAFTLLDMEQARREARLPKCVRCGNPIQTDTYLDLSDFGVPGYACETCVDDQTHSIENWEDD